MHDSCDKGERKYLAILWPHKCACQGGRRPLAIHGTSMYAGSMKLTKDLVAASAVPLVLSILEEGESYGYAIIQRVRQLSSGEIEWTDGMLYPVLHRLEEQGFITARWQDSEAGRK